MIAALLSEKEGKETVSPRFRQRGCCPVRVLLDRCVCEVDELVPNVRGVGGVLVRRHPREALLRFPQRIKQRHMNEKKPRKAPLLHVPLTW